MKTFEQQKDDHALGMGYKDWSEFIYSTDYPDIVDTEYNEVANKYATEVAKEALKNASENSYFERGVSEIDKQSILNENNIPKL